MSRPSGQPIRRVRGGQRGQLTVEAVGLLQLRGVAAAVVLRRAQRRQGGGDVLGLTPCEAEVLTFIARIRSQSSPWLIIRLIIQTIRWDPSGPTTPPT